MDTSYMTNGSLWLEVTSVDTVNSQFDLRFHNTTNSLYYQFLSKSNLTDSIWAFGAFLQGRSDTNITDFDPVTMTSSNMFFRGVEGNAVIQLYQYDNYTIRPASTNDSGTQGHIFFSIVDIVLPTDLTLFYRISGLATNGVDYVAITNQVVIPAGNSTVYLTIQGIYTTNWAPDTTLIITMILTNSYLVDPVNFTVTNIISDNKFQTVTNAQQCVGMDYDPLLNSLIVSGEFDFGMPGFDFERIGTNNSGGLAITNWLGITGVPDEIKLAIVKQTVNGFTNGDMYFGSDKAIGKLSANGVISNMNWCVPTNSIVPDLQGLRGSLCVDQTGIWSNNVIAVTGDGAPYISENRGVWRVNAQGQPTLVASIYTSHLEGVITLTNDVAKWGPWAGKILTGDEGEGLIYAVDASGTVTNFSLGINTEDFDLIPTNQDLYCADEGAGTITKIPRTLLAPYVGRLLITEAGEYGPPALFIVNWNPTNSVFDVLSFSQGVNDELEHVTFAPINLPTQ
jgi:hypothetical protein